MLPTQLDLLTYCYENSLDANVGDPGFGFQGPRVDNVQEGWCNPAVTVTGGNPSVCLELLGTPSVSVRHPFLSGLGYCASSCSSPRGTRKEEIDET